MAELKRDEGIILHAYEDSLGFLTIGIGRLIDKRQGGGISVLEAEYLFANDLHKVKDELDKELPWWTTLSDARQRVVANMCFNLGIRELLSFKNTLAKIETGDYEGASKSMLKSKWATQVGARATRLSKMMAQG